MAQGARVYVGFLGYSQSTAKYLPDFLASLRQQTFTDLEIIDGDNTPPQQDNPNQVVLESFPEVRYLPAGANLGFAKGYNRLFNLALQEGAEYFLVINPDVVLQPEAIQKLVDYLDINPEVAAVMPKILRWDFTHNRLTDWVDSLGVGFTKQGAFVDIGQGQLDDNRIVEPQPIFGFTGAGVLLRLSALSSVAFDNGQSIEYFDELMFMYKEDCDLSYRLRLAGWQIMLLPTAIIYHDRTAAKVGQSAWSQLRNRRRESKLIRQWSYLHQLIIFIKYWNLPKSLSSRCQELFYQKKRLLAALFFEPFVLSGWRKLWQQRHLIAARRRALIIKIKPASLEDWRQ
jgi:GT2 family glycosyltransferase